MQAAENDEAFGIGDDNFARFQLVGQSPSFRAALHLLKKIAAWDVTALIQGETGTGKELAARAIHYLGARASYPFLPINCGAIPDNLVENELFGHAAGAYTDARDRQAGLVADAAGGTLFMDEVETLSPKAQVALLRFLQDGIYRPLGGRHSVRANVRILAATNTDLHELVRARTFRADLLYRLEVMVLSMPPLRARGDDILRLAEHFLQRLAAQHDAAVPVLAPDSVAELLSYDWPGNVRELENLMHRAYLLAEGGVVCPDVRTRRNTFAEPNGGADVLQWRRPALEQGLARAKAAVIGAFERSFLQRVMAETQGNVSAAARLSGKERRAFGKLLKKYGIETRGYRGITLPPGPDHR
jgi:two-component system, NtrC family, response regulator GlrR